jgi:hypothetical protein
MFETKTILMKILLLVVYLLITEARLGQYRCLIVGIQFCAGKLIGLVWLLTEARSRLYSFCWWVVLPMSSGWLILQGSDSLVWFGYTFLLLMVIFGKTTSILKLINCVCFEEKRAIFINENVCGYLLIYFA